MINLMLKQALSCIAALLLTAVASASVTFTATFDHWTYVVTGDSDRVAISTTGGLTPTLSADLPVGAYPEGGDNPDSDRAEVVVEAYATYNITATKTVGDPFTGVTDIYYQNGMALDAYASCSNSSTAYAESLGAFRAPLSQKKLPMSQTTTPRRTSSLKCGCPVTMRSRFL